MHINIFPSACRRENEENRLTGSFIKYTLYIYICIHIRVPIRISPEPSASRRTQADPARMICKRWKKHAWLIRPLRPIFLEKMVLLVHILPANFGASGKNMFPRVPLPPSTSHPATAARRRFFRHVLRKTFVRNCSGSRPEEITNKRDAVGFSTGWHETRTINFYLFPNSFCSFFSHGISPAPPWRDRQVTLRFVFLDKLLLFSGKKPI